MKSLIIALLSALLFVACSQKHSSYVKGEWDELFEDDGNFKPVNSAKIQRELGGVVQ